ncbi:MAG: GNAT family N-acetyltransferase [Thermoguttaceae bacterium]
MKKLHVHVVNDVETFHNIREKWNSLADASAYPNIFTTWEWSFLWWKHFGQPAGNNHWELFILLVESNETEPELLAIFPFYRIKKEKNLNWLGYGARPCAEYLGPIIKKEMVSEVVEATMEFLTDNPQQWNSIFFEDYALDDSGTVAFASSLKERFLFRSAVGEPRYYIPLPNSYDEYLKTLSQHNRKRKKERINQAKSRYNAALTPVQSAECDAGFATLVELTTLARDKHRQKNPYDSSSYFGLHHDLVTTLLPQGKVNLMLLTFESKPASLWYVYLYHEKCYAHQQGHDTSLKGSPSDVALQMLLMYLIENGYKEFDFLRGGEWYKTSYTETTRPTELLTIYRTKNTRYFRDWCVCNMYRPIKHFVKKLLIKMKIYKE